MAELLLLAVVFAILVIGGLIVRGWSATLQATDGAGHRPRMRHLFRDCPGCGEAILHGEFDCPHCGLLLDSGTARHLARLRTAQAEVRALAEDGDIDAATAESVVAKLERRARTLRGLPAEPTPAPPVAEAAPALPVPPETAAASVPLPLPLEEAPPPAVPVELPRVAPPAEPPRRAAGFAAFMEERNILWGELVGGLLIVGCSIALVVTLWQRLEAFPYFPFALSAAVTLALYGAGHYTLHHWKLAATSRGLLVISLLLAPLNLLLLSDAITRGEPSLSLELGVKLAAVLGFVWVVRGGARDVLTARPRWRWLLPVAVVGAAATQLLPGEWVDGGATSLPAWLTLGCFAAACLLALRGERAARDDLPRDAGVALLVFVGLAAFALAAAWGLHVARSPDVAVRVAGLALPVVLAGAVTVGAGLLVHRRVFDGATKAAGLAVALAGFVAMTGGLAAAWPDPGRVLLCSLAAGLFLTRVALRESLPWVQAAAIPALALAAVVGFHGAAGGWGTRPLAELLRSPPSAAVLTTCALILATLAEWLARRERRAVALSYARGAAGVALAGLLLASVNGLDHPATAAAVHAATAAGLLPANRRWRLRVLAQGGLWLVLLGSLWTLHAAAPGERSEWGFVVAAEGLAFALLGLMLKGKPRSAARLLRRAAGDVALAAAILAPALSISASSVPAAAWGGGGVFALPLPGTPWDTGTLFALGLACLALARLSGAAVATHIGSAAVLLGLLHLALVTTHWEPVSRAVLVGLLVHATLATLVAFLSRHLERVLARPLRTSAVLTSGLAALILFFPPPALALLWAGCAVWLAAVWLAFALVWREAGAFPAFQGAVSLAAVLCAVAWLGESESLLGYFGPAALHAYSVALGLLALGWVVARRLLGGSAPVHEVWVGQAWSAERVVLAAVVVGQLALAALAVAPEVRAELAPAGRVFVGMVPTVLVEPFGAGAWAALAVLAAAVLASWRLTATGRETATHLAGLMLLFLAAPVVWAKSHAADVASASALRWGLASVFAGGTVAVSLRGPLRRSFERLGFALDPSVATRTLLLAILGVAAAVVTLVSAQAVDLAVSGRAPPAPVAGSIFAGVGAVVSNVVPLALVVLGLACSAARERSPGYAFTAGLVFAGTVAAGHALGVVTHGGRIDGVERIRVWLLLCAAASAWGAAWLAAERRVTGERWLAVQSRLGLGGLALLAVLPAAVIVARPGSPLDARWDVVGHWGGVVLALAGTVAVWRARRAEPRLEFHAVMLVAVAAGVVLACGLPLLKLEGEWQAFHVLAVAWTAVGVGLVIATRQRGESSPWLDGLAAALAVLALRAGWDDPWRPWLPAGLASVAALVAGAGAILTRHPIRVVASGLLFNLAAVLAWVPTDHPALSGFLLANAAGLAVAAAIWASTAIRLCEERWKNYLDAARGLAHLLLWFGLAPTLAGDHTDPVWITWGATIAVTLSMFVACRQEGARIARGGYFAAGGAIVLLTVSVTTTRPVWDVWQTPIALAGYAVLLSGSWATDTGVTRFVFRLPRPRDWSEGLVAHGILAAIVGVLAARNGLTFPTLSERLASPASACLLLLSAVLLLRAVPVWASLLRSVAVALAVLVPATVAWAVPDPAGVAPWLQRNAWLFVALAAAGVAATELAPSLGESWRRPARSGGGVAAALAVLVLGIALVQQVPAYDPVARHTPLGPAAVFAVITGIVALVALAVRLALGSHRDPLRLPDHRRTLYVYLAEVLVVLLFAHVRFNVPELFLAAAAKYWTFAVMGIAFVGVGLAELFERRRLAVLAGPLRRTGVLLPLLPLLAFWAKPPAALAEFAAGHAPGLSPLLAYLEKLPQHFDTYAWLWFLAGGLYGLVALSRNSFGWALLAALSTNASLWALLTHHEVPFAVHPQAWVIPLALVVLVSEHVNRYRLRADLSAAMRYAGIGMIYVASASDMFLAGVGQSPWLPVVLALLCVLGVLTGIVLRVRAFVLLGVGFLLLDVFAMIWHAAVDLKQTWVWYASGIVLGVAILALFAVFEKKAARGGHEVRD